VASFLLEFPPIDAIISRLISESAVRRGIIRIYIFELERNFNVVNICPVPDLRKGVELYGDLLPSLQVFCVT
jgi:hypothetical protein